MHRLHNKTITVRGWIMEGAEEGEERAFVLPQSLPADWEDGLDFRYAGELGFIATDEEIATAGEIAELEIIVFDRAGRNAAIAAKNARGFSDMPED